MPTRTCPVCGASPAIYDPLAAFYADSFRKSGFDFGIGDFETLNAEEYSCRSCGASDRERLLALEVQRWLIEEPSGSQGRTVLDFAPGQAFERMMRRIAGLTYRTADIRIAGVDIKLNITEMPEVEDNSLDLVICSHILEHVDNDMHALRELFRVCRPGGALYVLVPIVRRLRGVREGLDAPDALSRWRYYGQDDHVRLYSQDGLLDRLMSANFNVDLRGIGRYGKAVFASAGLSRSSVLYVCTKPAM